MNRCLKNIKILVSLIPRVLVPVIYFSVAAFSSEVRADQILILSGGGSPLSNHYSQYLQTKTLTDNLRTMIPGTDVSVLFGAGNVAGQQPILADVHRVIHDSSRDLVRDIMFPGAIDSNQVATRENVDRLLQQAKFSSMGRDETFFLFVSGHGMPNQSAKGLSERYTNNCIDLWAFSAIVAKDTFTTGSFDDHCFSKTDLQKYIQERVTAKRTVFAMNQCYSGGFHRMSVSIADGYPKADPRICGFTAVTEDETAEGCVARVDDPEYKGYERYLTQQLTGVDVVTGRRLRPPKPSVNEAHQAATLEDVTKNIPISTSDSYLWNWAKVISRSNFKPRTNTDLSPDYFKKMVKEAVIGKKSVKSPDYRAKEDFFQKMQRQILHIYPEAVDALKADIDGHEEFLSYLGIETYMMGRSWMSVVSDLKEDKAQLVNQWRDNVERGGVPSLSSFDKRTEINFFGVFDKTYGYGGGDEVSLYSMSMKFISDPAYAENLSLYRANRVPLALEWAESSGDSSLKTLAARIRAGEKEVKVLRARHRAAEAKHGQIRRLLIYRQVLGAWAALAAMNEAKGLDELGALLDCESARLR